MTTFRSAVSNTTETTNGMTALVSSMNKVVDLFFAYGASRGKDITTKFADAYNENPDLAVRTLLWGRDVRSGSGERDVSRQCLLWLEANHPDVLAAVLYLLPELGRYDDLLIFQTKEIQDKAFCLIGDVINAGLRAEELLSRIDTMSEAEVILHL